MSARAALLQRALADEKKLSKAKTDTRKNLKAYLALLPAFEGATGPIGATAFKNMWYASEDPISDIAHQYSGTGLDLIRVHTGAAIQTSTLFKKTLLSSTLGKFFIESARDLGGEAIVAFTMKGYKCPWIMTNTNLPNSLTFIPRLVVPVSGTHREIVIMSADLLVEDMVE